MFNKSKLWTVVLIAVLLPIYSQEESTVMQKVGSLAQKALSYQIAGYKWAAGILFPDIKEILQDTFDLARCFPSLDKFTGYDKIINKEENVSPRVKQFVIETIKEVPPYIKYADYYGVYYDRMLYISQEYVSDTRPSLDTLLAYKQKLLSLSDEEYKDEYAKQSTKSLLYFLQLTSRQKALDVFEEQLDDYRGTLFHEERHFKNNDAKRDLLFNIGITSLASLCSYGFVTKIWQTPRVLPAYLMVNFLAQNIFKKEIWYWHARKTEREADNAIPDDIKLLSAQVRSYKSLEKALQQWKSTDWKKNNIFYKGLRSLYARCGVELLDREHPTATQRAAQFQKRIDALEKNKA